MFPAISGTCGLFSALQDALSRGDRRRVRINQHVHATTVAFRALVDSLVLRPMPLYKLTPSAAPIAIGASDVCRLGMGGVRLFPDPNIVPIIWRQPFPDNIFKTLITADHQGGTVSISDLELIGITAHKDMDGGPCHGHPRAHAACGLQVTIAPPCLG